MDSSTTLQIRPALESEIPTLNSLIEESVRRLQAEDYSESQRESALATVFGVDTQLVKDGTYLVVEAMENEPAEKSRNSATAKPTIVACGGWSKRRTLYGADQWTQREDSLLDPAKDAAKIRAFFIHPDWARRGIGTMLLEACEKAAREAGFKRFDMGATLTGAKLFGARGYVVVERRSVPLRNGEELPIIHMEKQAES
jgi:GNAT superfamily N-acetyltransferase